MMTEQPEYLEYVKPRYESDPLAIVMQFMFDDKHRYPSLVLADAFEDPQGGRYKTMTGSGGWVAFVGGLRFKSSRRDGGVSDFGPFPDKETMVKKAIEQFIRVVKRYVKDRTVTLTRKEYKEIRDFCRRKLEWDTEE